MGKKTIISKAEGSFLSLSAVQEWNYILDIKSHSRTRMVSLSIILYSPDIGWEITAK